MGIKRKVVMLVCLGLFMMACTFGGLVPSLSNATPTSGSEGTTAPATQTVSQTGDMNETLNRLGGQPCVEKPEFTCVTLEAPLDHFDTANQETIDLVFAVMPASGERLGMFVQAFPGGPGGEGISNATTVFYPDEILEHFDLVFFDQRGIGLSEPLACPNAYAASFLDFLNETDQAGVEGYDTPEEQQAAIDSTRTFVQTCVAEIGVDPARLSFYGTDQVAEDIESFRQTVGDEKFWLYGVSYGTAVAQTYAAAHPEHLAGLVLDGTIDMTLTGEEGALAQEKAFDRVLVAVLEACDEDEACAAEMGGDALSVYDTLAAQISENPVSYELPVPSGGTVSKTFTFNQLEFTTAYQMYSIGGRMLFLRALAAAKDGDMVPLARLLHQQGTLDPATGEYLGDPTFSDTMFYGVNCTDDSYYTGTPEERIAQVIEEGQNSNGTVPRLDGSIYTGLSCAFWPSAPQDAVDREPLVAEGVPTFVLNATLDPATPFEQGKAVFERLDNGYHLYVEGGPHSIFGYGETCPDDYVTDFMVRGELPAEREIRCSWDPAVISAYEPLLPEDVRAFADPLEIFSAIDSELSLQPEYYYSYLTEEETFACPRGGSFTFGPSDVGESYRFTDCAFIQGFAMTGTGSFDYSSGVFRLETQVTGEKTGMLTYTHDYRTGELAVTGDYGGETIDLQQ